MKTPDGIRSHCVIHHKTFHEKAAAEKALSRLINYTIHRKGEDDFEFRPVGGGETRSSIMPITRKPSDDGESPNPAPAAAPAAAAPAPTATPTPTGKPKPAGKPTAKPATAKPSSKRAVDNKVRHDLLRTACKPPHYHTMALLDLVVGMQKTREADEETAALSTRAVLDLASSDDDDFLSDKEAEARKARNKVSTVVLAYALFLSSTAWR